MFELLKAVIIDDIIKGVSIFHMGKTSLPVSLLTDLRRELYFGSS